MAKKKIGRIVNFFGLKGQVKVSVASSVPEERFKPGKKILMLNETNEEQTYVIKSLIIKNSRIVNIGLEGYDDINDIQWMIGRDIYQNVRAPKGTFFFDELVGMEVLTDKEESLGTVDHIEHMPTADYLVIGKTTYIPFILEKFVESVDKKEKKIRLTALGTESAK